jgi:hypothetical protein
MRIAIAAAAILTVLGATGSSAQPPPQVGRYVPIECPTTRGGKAPSNICLLDTSNGYVFALNTAGQWEPYTKGWAK